MGQGQTHGACVCCRASVSVPWLAPGCRLTLRSHAGNAVSFTPSPPPPRVLVIVPSHTRGHWGCRRLRLPGAADSVREGGCGLEGRPGDKRWQVSPTGHPKRHMCHPSWVPCLGAASFLEPRSLSLGCLPPLKVPRSQTQNAAGPKPLSLSSLLPLSWAPANGPTKIVAEISRQLVFIFVLAEVGRN